MTQANLGTSGTLGRIKQSLKRNRLGELLVLRGTLSPLQLKTALAYQSHSRVPLGRILVEHGFVRRSDIISAIAVQWAMRYLATIVTVMIAVSAFNIRSSFAATDKDIPASVSTVSAAIGPIASYPELFNSGEKRSSDLSAFTKWNSMFSRFDTEMQDPASAKIMKEWKANLESMKGLSLEAMVERVNNMANRVAYINDSKNWKKSDYWATPIEFFKYGGDCEDFAIAKYASLRALGVPDSRMRVAIVKDLQKNIPHAILIVYTDNGPVLLDNQIKTVKASTDVAHYKPIFSINRTAWWLHKPQDGMTLAAR